MRRRGVSRRAVALIGSSAVVLGACEAMEGVKTRVVATAVSSYEAVVGQNIQDRIPEDQTAVQALSHRQPIVGIASKGTKGLLGPELYDMDGLVQAPRLSNYLRNLTERSVAQYPSPKNVRNVLVEASERLNAFATVDRDIYVSLGLLEAMETESQLAAVLAHEAAHIQLDHLAREEYFNRQRELVTTGAGVAVLAVQASQLRVTGTTVSMSAAGRQEAAEGAAGVAATSWMINTISDDVLDPRFRREQEREADLVAADLTVAAGYDADGTPDMLRRLGEVLAQREALAAVLERERDRAAAKLAASGDPVAALSLLPSLGVEMGVATVKELHARVGSSHPSPQERQEAAAAYVAVRYEDRMYDPEQRAEDTARLEAEMARALPERLRRGHRAAQKAKLLLAEGKVAEARREAAAAVADLPGSAHSRTIMALVQIAEGSNDAALRSLEAIDRGEIKPKRTFELLAAQWVRVKRFADADRALAQGEAQFGDAEPFLPSRIIVAAAAGDAARARLYHDRCRTAASTQIKLACDRAIAPMRLEGVEPATSPGVLDRLQGVVPDIGDWLGTYFGT
jgi:predicted Zn-dependent protease